MALFNTHATGGGAEQVVRLEYEEMLRRGVRCRWFVACRDSESFGAECIPHRSGPSGINRFAKVLERLAGLQCFYDPPFRAFAAQLPNEADILHLHSIHGRQTRADIESVAKIARRMPVVMTLHDLWWLSGHCALPLECTRWKVGCGRCPDLKRYPAIPRDGTGWNWRRKQRAFTRCSVDLIVPSAWVRDQVAQSPILRHLPIHVVPNPVDKTVFRPADKATSRRRLGIPATAPVVLLLAQSLSSPLKGCDDAIAALSRLNVSDLIVLAIGHNSEDVVSQVRHRVVPVAYQTEQSALADYYLAADVFLMPSKCETFGMAAAEAMACATPVVAYAVGGLVDVVGDISTGALVRPGDVAEFAAAIDRLLSNHTARAAIGRQASRRVSELFSLSRHADLCMDVYAQAVARHHAKGAFSAQQEV
ncbi:MAG: glycosyltransferase [Planctomycetaceae bacterium]|nr:glycosyltransferase [Planctomycetaceae bacterium]